MSFRMSKTFIHLDLIEWNSWLNKRMQLRSRVMHIMTIYRTRSLDGVITYRVPKDGEILCAGGRLGIPTSPTSKIH